MSRIALVTGAGAGIGLELCRQLLAAGDEVIACPRVPGSEGLTALLTHANERLHVIPTDVGDASSIASMADEARKRVDRIDLLFNNAGIYPKSDGGLENLDFGNLQRAYQVNTLGPLRVAGALLPLLRRGQDKRLIQITSLMGSISDNGSGGSWSYRISKTALNMAVRNMAHELANEGFICLAIHPGWVETRMGGGGARTSADTCVEEILRTTLSATARDNGGFRDSTGGELPY
jgi:NAD(P)-dependent dehydrogenase (short-subunit alcohol dehydrogenase family)